MPHAICSLEFHCLGAWAELTSPSRAERKYKIYDISPVYTIYTLDNRFSGAHRSCFFSLLADPEYPWHQALPSLWKHFIEQPYEDTKLQLLEIYMRTYLYPRVPLEQVAKLELSASHLLAWDEFWFRKTSACRLTEQWADLIVSVNGARSRSRSLLIN